MKYRKNGTDALCGQCDLCGGELRRGAAAGRAILPDQR